LADNDLNTARFTVLLPTYNEVENIAAILDSLSSLYPAARILVLDDSSTDGTQKAVEQSHHANGNITLIERDPDRRGLTASVMEGISRTETPYFIVMDADFQHPPASVRRIMQKLAAGSDIVVGVRETKEPMSLDRRIASQGAHRISAFYLWTKRQPRCRDTMSGFFGGRTDLFRDIVTRKGDRFERKGFKVLFDLLKFSPRNLKMDEMEFQFGDRAGGLSKMSSIVILSILRQCGVVGKATAVSVDFFFVNRTGRVVGMLILGAIVAIALLMNGAKPTP
jgi:dolichol-phosphate mannosyltransferase